MARLVLLLHLVAACGSSAPGHYVDTKSYGRTCTTVADCFAVYGGPVGCCGGGCPNTAIRADLLPKYVSAFDEAMKCSTQPPCPPPVTDCVGRLSCDNGTCQLDPPPDASAGDR